MNRSWSGSGRQVDRGNTCKVLESCEVAPRAHCTYVTVPQVSHGLTSYSLVRALHLSGDLVDGLVEERRRRNLEVGTIGSDVDVDVCHRYIAQPR
jgi:hypothetical protein